MLGTAGDRQRGGGDSASAWSASRPCRATTV